MSSHCCRLLYNFLYSFAWDNGFQFFHGSVSSPSDWWGILEMLQNRAWSELSGGQQCLQPTAWDFQSDRLDLTLVTDGNSFFCFATPEVWFQQGGNPSAIRFFRLLNGLQPEAQNRSSGLCRTPGRPGPSPGRRRTGPARLSPFRSDLHGSHGSGQHSWHGTRTMHCCSQLSPILHLRHSLMNNKPTQIGGGFWFSWMVSNIFAF